MAKVEREWMTDDEAIAHVMRVTGKNYRQAKAALIEKFRKGEIRASGINTTTGKREQIPTSAWRQALADRRGDH
jgi:hypothetical protein